MRRNQRLVPPLCAQRREVLRHALQR